MIFGITGPRPNKSVSVDEYNKNNARNEILVLINEYEKTDLNINQISSMLVSLMGNTSEPDDRGDPENKSGIPYHPSVISTEIEYDGRGTHTLSISMTAMGRREVVHAYRKQFIEMMNCAKAWHSK